ncbi:kinesin-like protein KIF20B [Engraulis encrasicolus]|uniref:kinesin-like protein KIF20B n=1 Tax=Engraulis encrasicolus TaxID=184585 RepID=UPI002FD2C737
MDYSSVGTRVAQLEEEHCADVKKDLLSQFSGMSHNQIVEKEHLKVYLRIRPFTSSETENGESQDCVATEPPDTVVLRAPKMSMSARLSDKSVSQITQRFQFSQIYGPETTQKEMFDGTVKTLVKDVLDGENSLVFTYGVTNAGKTYTFLGTEKNEGILPRSLSVIFNRIEGRVSTQMNLKPQRCREFTRLSSDEQNEEAAMKRGLFKLLKESDQKNTSNQSDSREASTLSEIEGSLTENSFNLELEEQTKFSVWVSFCEIYNENIHDLLEPLPNGATRRPALRLSQDVKGNLFVKDLRWVQANSAEEAFKVMRLGRKNQSFSSTKLNQLSSRSHSIFSIRIMRIDGISRVKVSELSLCDLAGSERCAKTQNVGDRLKEAGNINTSLLTLGKCINILRYNQQAKVPQLVPFRESKLTHYLQSYFMGRGKACMIVNINQCASMYDETLNVLKFSAVAQKVVVLSTRTIQDALGARASRKVSMIINNADRNYEQQRRLRRSSLVQWDSSLEDVQEDEDDEEEEEEESTVEDTIQDDSMAEPDREAYEEQLAELRAELQKMKNEKLLMDCRIREEVTKDFSELFTQMETDFRERLEKEKAIIEERSEKRLELLKDLVRKNSNNEDEDDEEGALSHDEQSLSLDEMIGSICSDVDSIRRDAEEAQSCLVAQAPPPLAPMAMLADLQSKVTELTEQLVETQTLLSDKTSELDKCHKHLEELEESKKKIQVSCKEMAATMAKQTESLTTEREQMETIRKELSVLKGKCKCSGVGGRSLPGDTRKRRQQERGQGLDGQPPLKKGAVEDFDNSGAEESSDPMEVKGQLEVTEAESAEFEVTEAESAQLAEMQRRCQSLEQHMQELEQELAGYERVTHTQEAELKEKSALIEKLLQQIQQLQDRLDESSATAAATAVSRQEERQKSSQNARTLELEISQLKEQLKQQEVRSEQLKQQQEVMPEQRGQKEARLMCEQLLQADRAVTDTTIVEDTVKDRQELDEKQAVLSTKETELNHRQKELVNKEAELCQREKELSEREAQLQLQGQHQTPCAEPDKEVGELQKQSGEENEKAHRLKETSLAHREQELEQKLVNMTSHLSEREEQLARRDADLSRREEALESKLAQKGEELTKKEKELTAKLVDGQAALTQREAELQRSLALREAELVRKEEELQAAKEAGSCRKEEGVENEALLHQALATTQSENAELSEKEELEKRRAAREAELARREACLSQKEEELSRLQRRLREEQERAEEAESAAVQEARRREAERRRELLAVAEEAIAQKDAELQKRQQDIQRLKDEMKAGADKVQSLTVDLQRQEDDSSDLKEKLVDSKKQIQQVQKEISSMREMEKSLKQKVQDLEKSRSQLQKDLASRDRTIHQLKTSADSQSDETLVLYQKACKDLQAREQVMEDMRLVLTEQEETQNQMDLELETQLENNQQLTQEVEKLKALLLRQDCRRASSPAGVVEGEADSQTREELTQAQEELKSSNEKYQSDRKRWLEEKMVLIRQAKEAEERRNQEMRRFADERDRHGKQQTEMEGLSERLAEREHEMERWRLERDTLVSALEVQLQKLIASNRDKDQQLQSLQSRNTPQPPEGEADADARADVERLQRLLCEREAEIQCLQEQLKTSTSSSSQPGPSAPAPAPAPAPRPRQDSSTQTIPVEEPTKLSDFYADKPLDTSTLRSTEKTRASVISQASSGYPSVLESSEISTDAGRRSRFPRPELEISFSPLQPDRLALKRQGDEEAVTVKITRSARKRKSNDMEKDPVESENKRNTRTTRTPKLAVHQEERSPALMNSNNSQSSLRSGREGKLQKIGDFLHSSPTFLGSKAKKIMGLVSGKSDVERGCSSSKRPKKKLFHPEISAPMDIPAHQIIGREPEEKDSDHLIIKRRLRNRLGK